MTKIVDKERLKQVTKLETIECHAELESTMDRARALAVEVSVPLPALVIALHQKSGRGRRGAGWWQPTGSLAMTLVVDIPTEGNFREAFYLFGHSRVGWLWRSLFINSIQN